MGELLNVTSLVVAFAAVALSSVLSWRAVAVARDGNHIPVVTDLLAPHRNPDFIRKERLVHEKLKEFDLEAGFDALPDPMWEAAVVVSEQYQMLGYLVVCGLADADLLVHQVRHGAIRTWVAIEPLVQAERRLRGGEFSFLNSFERFVEIARSVDVQVSDVVDGRWRSPDGRSAERRLPTVTRAGS
ncbi:hypothetical protein AB0C12_05480 [Actinoplanes sp. NPDC048967]|uniref:hypothetical protein n=1 Tax=Actinoplanes sp. NPDC048967 TaxID=3155269 RepID=UPI0033C9C407